MVCLVSTKVSHLELVLVLLKFYQSCPYVLSVPHC